MKKYINYVLDMLMPHNLNINYQNFEWSRCLEGDS